MRKGTARSETEPGTLDERVRRSKEAVLAATYQLLQEAGLSGVSVDAVSARSGVAKTTIYRHWPSRSALLMDACAKMRTKPETPDTGSLKGDLTVLATGIAEKLRSKNFSSVLPSVIDAAERDPEIAEMHSRMHAGLMTPLHEVIERARKREPFRRGCVDSEIVAALIGPLFYRRWFSREPLDDKFVKNVIDRVVAMTLKSAD